MMTKVLRCKFRMLKLDAIFSDLVVGNFERVFLIFNFAIDLISQNDSHMQTLTEK